MRILLVALALGSSALGACTTTEAGSGQGPARSLAVTATPPEPAEFVRQSRPAAAPDYIPVGVTPPAREEKTRDAAQLQKLESELTSDRERSRAFARRPTPRSTYDGSIPPRPPKNAPASE